MLYVIVDNGGINLSINNSDLKLHKHLYRKQFLDIKGRKRVYTTDNLYEVTEFLHDKDILLSYKLSGQPVTVHYENGELVSADICNDGITGFDITQVVWALQGIPRTITEKEAVSICGTAILRWEDYNQMCSLFQEANTPILLPKAIITQSLLNIDINFLKQFDVHFLAYDMFTIKEFETKREILIELENMGFTTIHYNKVEKNLSVPQLNNILNNYGQTYFPYPTSGLVLESENLYTNCFDPNERIIVALLWPFDVKSRMYIGVQRILSELDMEKENSNVNFNHLPQGNTL